MQASTDAQSTLPIESGLLFANPIPTEHSIAKAENDRIINEAIRAANLEGVRGSENTPFILKKIRELSGGKTVHANRKLIESNVQRGTKVAVELAKLEKLYREGPNPASLR